MVSWDNRCGNACSSTIARVSIFGFFDSRTTSAWACATSLDPHDAIRTRSFWDSLPLISDIEDEEAAFGRGCRCRQCVRRGGKEFLSVIFVEVIDRNVECGMWNVK